MHLKKVSFALLIICTSVSLAYAQDRGLHNSSKKFTDPSQMRPSDWTDPREMHRTYVAAIVMVPRGNGRSRQIKAGSLAKWKPRSGGKLPAVIYMHGCSGIWPGTKRRVEFMADLGFVVIAPASFARKKYPQSCNPDTHQGGMYRNILKMRQNDAAYAIAQVRKLPFVDPSKIILMGLSEGGITTATLPANRYKTALAARIVEGWTCHAGWSEYKGLKARASEPVLTLVGELDPWFQDQWTKGNCSRFVRTDNGGRSVVYRSGKLAREHELLEHKQPRKDVIKFLKERGLLN